MTERKPSTIAISAGLWRGFDVLVEPPISSHPLRSFRDHGAAMAHAEALHAVEGWTIVDRTEGGSK